MTKPAPPPAPTPEPTPAPPDAFKVGDTVRVKGQPGSILMTIETLKTGAAMCLWWTGSRFSRCEFPQAILEGAKR